MRRPEVLRDTDFRRFYIGQLVSFLGDQASVLAIPLTGVLVLDAGPFQLGLLTAVSILPSLLFSLWAGAMVDRRGRRRQTMLVADAGRALAVLSLPVAYVAGHLTLAHLYIVAFVVGTLDVAFAVAYQALLVAMVTRRDYLAANSLLNGTRSLAEVVGLALGGTLVALVTAPVALALNSLSFVVSGAQLARIHPAEPPGDTSTSGGLTGGMTWIRGNPVVRTLLLSTGTTNFFAFIGNALLVLYASQTLGLNPTVIGLVFGAGAVGGVIGAATCRRVEKRVGLGRAVLIAAFALPAAMLLYPAARGSTLTGALLLAAGEFLAAVAALWLDISIGAVFAQQIPDQLRSRVAGAYRTVNHGIRPLGALLGGLLGTHVGLRGALLISAIGAVGGALLLLRPAVTTLTLPNEPAAQEG
ncbi:MAG: MFS transporter [Lapillicoccus sp.]